MLRSGAARSLRRSVFSSANGPVRATRSNATFITSSSRASGLRRPANLSLTVHKPVTTALQRYASTIPVGPGTPFDKIDKKAESKRANEPIDPDPDAVSIDSSVRHVFGEEGVEDKEKDTDMLAGVKADLVWPIASPYTHMVHEVTRPSLRKPSKRPLPSMTFPAKLSTSAWRVSYRTSRHPYRQSIWHGTSTTQRPMDHIS